MFAALEQNLIQRKVAATRAAREANIAKRKDGADRRQRIPEPARGRRRACWMPSRLRSRLMARPRFKFDALPPMRLAAPFEACATARIRSSKHRRAAKSFSRQPRHAGRLHRARDLCQELLRDRRHRGGRYRGIYRSGAPSPPPSRRPARDWRACARPTRSMPSRRLAAARALQAAGAKHIYLAGRPGEQEAALRGAGVSDFIFAGGDALAMLQEAWRRMERA